MLEFLTHTQLKCPSRSSRMSATPLQHSVSHSSLSKRGLGSGSPPGTFRKSTNSSAAELANIAGSSPSSPTSIRKSASIRKVASTSSLPVKEGKEGTILTCQTPRISSSLERLTQVTLMSGGLLVCVSK